MNLPPMLQGDSLTRLLQGAAAGCAITLIVGFGWGGWQLHSKAEKMAQDKASAAVVAVLGYPAVELLILGHESIPRDLSYPAASLALYLASSALAIALAARERVKRSELEEGQDNLREAIARLQCILQPQRSST